jgi:HEAT repeat protein
MEALRQGTLVLALVLVAGCSSPPPPPPPPPEKKRELSAEVSRQIDDALELLNNANIEEKYRNQLIAAAETDDLGLRAVIDRSSAAVKRSWDPAHKSEHNVLNPSGRRRVVEALDKVAGTDSVAMELFKLAAKDQTAEVSAAATSALAARGDESAVAGLLASLRQAKDDAPTQQRARDGLLKLAKPERLDACLAAMDAGSRVAFTPVVDACLPADVTSRSLILRKIAGENGNPQARILALGELKTANDPELVPLARGNVDSSDQDLRTTSLVIVKDQGGDAAAGEIAAALDKDPADAEAVARLLGTIDSTESVTRAVAILGSAERKPATRAAVAAGVLARLKDEAAPPALRDPAAREKGLAALRKAISDPDEVVARAAIDALGASGDESEAESLVELLTSKPAMGDAVVRSLGRLGGTLAVETLVDRHQNEPKLRASCRDALASMKGLDKALSLDQGLLIVAQLRANDLELRTSALAILRALKGDSDVHDYDPRGEPAARARSVDRWIAWWKQKKQRGE